MHGIINGMSELSLTASIFLQSVSYYITEIQDEQVPLASRAGNQFYLPTILGMTVLIFLLMLITYWIGCRNYQKRIKELDEEKKCYCGWNFWKLRETVNELELQKADDLLNEMQEAF